MADGAIWRSSPQAATALVERRSASQNGESSKAPRLGHYIGDWPIHSTGVAAVLVGPRAGVHYPGSTGGLQAWFRTDSDCVEPPSTRGYPPSLERPPAGRPSRASDQHYSG